NGKQVASGSDDGTIKIWDATSGSCVKTLEGHGGWVRSVTFSHDGKQVASGSDDGTIKIWDATSGSCVKTLEGHSGWVRSVTFSHDGKQVASGSDDGTIKIWDATSGSCVKTLEGHGGWVRSVTFSHDGKQVASGLDDGTIKIWDAISGSCIQTISINSTVTDVFFDHANAYLHTNIGRIQIATTHTESFNQLDNPKCSSYGLGQANCWITCNGQNVLWLPQEYRPYTSAMRGRKMALICHPGRVLIFSFSQDV
ncbi:WD40-repeat-containing domain protein, partial [Cladorrhinum sp. PSN332]